jgi:signal peptidase I
MACRRIRRLTERLVLFFTGLIFLRMWFLDGFPVFCKVQGGSMATTLLGDHVDSTCPNCHFTFSCDAHDNDDAPIAFCPNCAAKFAPPESPQVLAGDRVLIDLTAFQIRRPKRWEVVAFRRLSRGPDMLVKRVVGLPDEKIEIKNGDVYADGRIQRKTLRQQRAMRVLVHDDDYDDHTGPASRWRPKEVGSNWSRPHGPRVHAENTGDEIGTLVYNHTTPGVDSVGAPARITDYSFYNRGRLQRSDSDHPMADVAMSFHVQDIHGRGLLSLLATDGRDEFVVQINPGSEKYVVLKNRETDPQNSLAASGKLRGSLRDQTIEVSLFDRQFLFAIGGGTLAAVNIDNPQPPPVAKQPLEIGVQGLGLVIDHLRVYRDVYYVMPPASEPGGDVLPFTLGANEYFVVGDNSPISEDSRTWTENRFVDHNSLVGKPFVVIYPACEISLGRWHIQVPDLLRIRYIR